DREGENFAAGAFGLRQIAGLVAEVAEALLKVQRDRIIDRGADLLGLERRKDRVPTTSADASDVLIEDVPPFGQDRRRREMTDQPLSLELLLIASSVALTGRGPVIEVPQLHSQNRCLQGVEAAVEANLDVVVSARVAVHAKTTHPSSEVGV